MGSETTAAATGAVGVIRRDPMAMLPFCGYNMGDYWKHWIEIGQTLDPDKAPKIFNVNWFRKDDEGNFLWPGFGDNMRVLDWIVDRCEGKVDAQETAIGYLPYAKDINREGLDMTEEQLDKILDGDKDAWEEELKGVEELYAKFGDHLPKELADELAAHLIVRLAQNADLRDFGKHACARLDSFSREYPFIQYLYLTDTKGSLKCAAITDPAYREKYEALPIGFDFSQREWFKMPMQTGDMHIMDVYQSQFTGKLVITVSCPVTDDDDNIVGVIGVDIQLEQLLKRSQALQQEARAAED